MARHAISPRPIVVDALQTAGMLIRAGRGERGWTAKELAARARVSERTVLAAEAGSPGTAFATVLELLSLTGNPIFGADDPVELARMRRRGEEKMELLPSRVRPRHTPVDDNF